MSLAQRLTDFANAIGADIKLLQAGQNAVFSNTGTLTVKVGTSGFPIADGTYTIVSVAARANTAPTGAAVILDVNKNGTSIFTTQANRPTIAVGANNATVGAFQVTSVTTGDYLSVDVDQIGSIVAGADLVVVVKLRKTA